jgi:hypothetical protein
MEPTPEVELSLSDRLPDYLATFTIGLAASTAVGLLIFFIWGPAIGNAIGYTIVMYGVVLLAAGGSSGGGYANIGIGAMGALFGTRRADDPAENPGDGWDDAPKVDSRERLRRGLRPEANPRAFWQVVAGFTYVGIGVGVAILFG